MFPYNPILDEKRAGIELRPSRSARNHSRFPATDANACTGAACQRASGSRTNAMSAMMRWFQPLCVQPTDNDQVVDKAAVQQLGVYMYRSHYAFVCNIYGHIHNHVISCN